jgi:hypothetical protein
MSLVLLGIALATITLVYSVNRRQRHLMRL